MGAYEKQARVALEVYLKRGHALIEALAGGDFDKALALSQWRTAAFQNFKVAYEIERGKGMDLGQEVKFQTLWQEIAPQNEQIEQHMQHFIDQSKNLFKKVRRTRTAIRRFHSGRPEESLILSKI